jgi:hypothetical protein
VLPSLGADPTQTPCEAIPVAGKLRRVDRVVNAACRGVSPDSAPLSLLQEDKAVSYQDLPINS